MSGLLQHKPAVQRIMDLARRFRSAPGDLYDQAYQALQTAAYGALCDVAQSAGEWRPIASAPTTGRKMFVVRAFDVTTHSGMPYTSDPWCVWREEDGKFARWPHAFAPTQWLPLPENEQQERLDSSAEASLMVQQLVAAVNATVRHAFEEGYALASNGEPMPAQAWLDSAVRAGLRHVFDKVGSSDTADSTSQSAPVQPKGIDVPEGYKLVMVPDEPAPDEPDWDECKRQAEVSTGLKVEPNTFSIVKREIRRWIAHKATAAPVQQEAAEPDGWQLVPVHPTESMVDAFHAEETDFARTKWKAMLEAAPSAAPAQAGETKGGAQ